MTSSGARWVRHVAVRNMSIAIGANSSRAFGDVMPLASRWFTDRADFTSMATTLPSGRSMITSTSTPERSRKWADVSTSSMDVACRVSSATTNDSRNAPHIAKPLLHVEAELHDVAVLHHVLLALDPGLAG